MVEKDKKVSELKKNDILNEVETWFSSDSTWDSDWRDNAKVWYQYYDGDQWTDDEITALKDRGQAVTTYNHIKPSIDSLIGSERQNRPKVTMAGRTLDDGRLAQAKTSLYNYITYNSSTDDQIDEMIKDAYITGRGWMHVYPEENNDKQVDLLHVHVDYRDIFVDPLSRNDDLTDCRRIHHAVFTDSDIIKQMFPSFEEDSGDAVISGFETSSEEEMWFEKADRTRPRLINTWYVDEKGDTVSCIWVKGQILSIEKNKYSNIKFPYVQYTLNRDINNYPYGFTRNMVSAQDEVNKRHSKALHYLNAKQVLAEENAFVNWEDAKKTLAKPDGIVKLQDGALTEGRVQVIDNTPLAAAHLQLLEIAKQEIFASAGINAAFLGQSSQYESAKKTQTSIAASQTSLVPALNKLRRTRHQLAEITMKLVPQFYVDKRIIRILNEKGDYEFMPLNHTQLADDDTLQMINDMSADDVDVIIEDAPAGLNEREEQFNQLLQIQGQTADPIPMDVLLRYSNIRDKHNLADDISKSKAIQSRMQQMQDYIGQLEKQIQQLGGIIQQKDNQIVQVQTARAVEKEVNKVKDQL